jgi:phosphatidylglycerophosphatase A
MDPGRPQDQAPRPPARLILTTPEHLVAFGFGAGLAPRAPGTVGTLEGVVLWLATHWLPVDAYLVLLAGLAAFGAWICGRSARLLGVHDSPGIVFDEIAGFMVAALPLLPAAGLVQASPWGWLLAAFVLFRIFDIWKPWPIRWLDAHVHGGTGIMLDDLAAGLCSAGVLALVLLVLG